MSFRKTALAAAAGMALASTPVLAQANQAASLSVASAVAQNDNANERARGPGFNRAWIVPGIIILGIIVVLVLIYTDDEDTISV